MMSPTLSLAGLASTCRMSPSEIVGSMLLPRARNRKLIPCEARLCTMCVNAVVSARSSASRCNMGKLENGIYGTCVWGEAEFVTWRNRNHSAQKLHSAFQPYRAMEGRKGTREQLAGRSRWGQFDAFIAATMLQNENVVDPGFTRRRKLTLSMPGGS